MLTFWERFRAFLDQTFGGGEAPPAGTSQPGPLKHLLDPIDQLRQQALRLREDEDQVRQQSLDLERQTALEHQREMRTDILELHRQLETGFDLDRLEQLSAALKEHCQEFRDQSRDELTEMAMLAVVSHFHQESLLWAWQEFEKRRLAHGVRWPEPLGLAPNADEEEVAEHRRLQLEQARAQFLQGPLVALADLMLGIVPSWRSLYPERGGAVWCHTVFEGVAGALAAARWQAIEKLADQHHQELEERIAAALGPELAGVQERLSRGVSSLAEARSLSEQVVARCQEVAPKAVWAYLEPLL